jgi:hypothetical protein
MAQGWGRDAWVWSGYVPLVGWIAIRTAALGGCASDLSCKWWQKGSPGTRCAVSCHALAVVPDQHMCCSRLCFCSCLKQSHGSLWYYCNWQLARAWARQLNSANCSTNVVPLFSCCSIALPADLRCTYCCVHLFPVMW